VAVSAVALNSGWPARGSQDLSSQRCGLLCVGLGHPSRPAIARLGLPQVVNKCIGEIAKQSIASSLPPNKALQF
jgi:hypothetical protein